MPPVPVTPGCVLCEFWKQTPFDDGDVLSDTKVATARDVHSALVSGFYLSHYSNPERVIATTCDTHRRMVQQLGMAALQAGARAKGYF